SSTWRATTSGWVYLTFSAEPYDRSDRIVFIHVVTQRCRFAFRERGATATHFSVAPHALWSPLTIKVTVEVYIIAVETSWYRIIVIRERCKLTGHFSHFVDRLKTIGVKDRNDGHTKILWDLSSLKMIAQFVRELRGVSSVRAMHTSNKQDLIVSRT